MATLGKTELVCQLRGGGRWHSDYWIHDQGWEFQACYGDDDVYRHPQTRSWVVVTQDNVDLRNSKYPARQNQPGWWRMIPGWQVRVDVWVPASWTDQQETEFLQWLQQRSSR